MKTIKSIGETTDRKTFFYIVEIPAGVILAERCAFCGTCSNPEAEITDIRWELFLGKSRFKITAKGQYRFRDYRDIIEKYAFSIDN